MQGTLIVIYIMPKKKTKKPDIKALKEDIASAKSESPEHADWKLCADTVDSLHVWINELCEENQKER